MKQGKKLLYLSTIEDGPYQGVRKKIKMQCDAFEQLGINVLAINSGKRSLWGQISKLLPFSFGLNYRLIKKELLQLTKNDFNYCYIRYSQASRGLIGLIKLLKQTQKGIRIILEIPTYPYEDELKSVRAFPFKIRDRLYCNRIKKYGDLIVTPSHIDEPNIFGIPAYEITNGIDVKSIERRRPTEKETGRVNLLGVALITPKQGYDRVIRGIHEYRKVKSLDDPEVYFYVIGKGSGKNELEQLRDCLGLQEYVFFPGEKENEELEEYYNIDDLGVGTLGLYKANELSKVNSLKTREYCAKGLPFIVTDCDYMFADTDFEFCLVVENDSTPIDIMRVIGFLNEKRKQYSDQEIIGKMADFAKENLSWSTILYGLINHVDRMHGNQ